MTNYLPVGVFGAGNVARSWHIPSLQKHAHVDIVAICDPNLERAREVAERFGIRSVFQTHEELLESVHVDAVTIATPNSVHAKMAIDAFEAGKHVMCEKPLATTVEDAQKMIEAAEKARKLLAVNMRFRANSNMAFVRNAVTDRRLGKVRYAKARWLRKSGTPDTGSWFMQRELSGGGVLMDIGVHMLDLLMWLLQFPKITGVRGEIQTLKDSSQGSGLGGWGIGKHAKTTHGVEDFAAVHLRLDDGGLVTIEVSWALFGHEEMRVQLFGDEGGADLFSDIYSVAHPVRIYREECGAPVQVIPTIRRAPGTDWERAISSFVSAIRGEGEPICTGKEAFEILRIIDATYRSAAEGREISF